MVNIRALIIAPSHEAHGAKLQRFLFELIRKAGADVLKLDDFTLGTSWVDPIMEAIRKADIIFFDITSVNGNVFYELGIAHALNKTTILLRDRDSKDPVPSDLQGFLYWAYDSRHPEVSLEEIVRKAIEEATKQKGGNDE